MSIDIYQPNEVSRWRRRMRRYRALRSRGLLFDDVGLSTIGLSIYLDSDSDTYIAPLANPGGGAGSGSGPCCCCEALGCNFSTTPAALSLTASGIDYTTIVGMCLSCEETYKIVVSPPNPNGTFTLTHRTGDCAQWSTQLMTGGTVNFYNFSDSTCSGTVLGSGPVTWQWFVTRIHTGSGAGDCAGGISSITGWSIVCQFQLFGFSATQDALYFCAQPATDTTIDCTGTVTADNTLGAVGTCISLTRGVWGTGGSVIFHPA